MGSTLVSPEFRIGAPVAATPRPRSFGMVVALGAPALVIAALSGLGLWSLAGRAPIDEAAIRTAQLSTRFTRLYDSDMRETLFPVMQGIVGRDGALRGPAACGLVVTGLDLSGPAPVVVWQTSQGTCPASRIGRAGGMPTVPAGAAALRSPAVVAVEVSTDPRAEGAHYAVAFAAPDGKALPLLVGGSRN